MSDGTNGGSGVAVSRLVGRSYFQGDAAGQVKSIHFLTPWVSEAAKPTDKVQRANNQNLRNTHEIGRVNQRLHQHGSLRASFQARESDKSILNARIVSSSFVTSIDLINPLDSSTVQTFQAVASESPMFVGSGLCGVKSFHSQYCGVLRLRQIQSAALETSK